MYQSAYAIYEQTRPTRVVLINYATDGSTYTAQFSVPASSVTVKRLTAPSVTELSAIEWAGQTWASSYDGTPSGQVLFDSVQCGPTCAIQVPAGSVALVFLTQQALADSTPPSIPAFAAPTCEGTTMTAASARRKALSAGRS